MKIKIFNGSQDSYKKNYVTFKIYNFFRVKQF